MRKQIGGDPITSAFKEGIGTDSRPDYKDPAAPSFFGPLGFPWHQDRPVGEARMPDEYPRDGAPLWARYAWNGVDGYENPKNEQGVVKPVAEAEKRKQTFADEGVHVNPEPGILGDYAEVAAIGAKGSGKSFTFGMASNARVQKYPGMKMAIVANSYDQAWGSGAEKLAKVARAMGLEFQVRGEMMIDDFKHRNVYYFPKFNAKVCVLSFDNIDLIEGTEWDGFWFEEVQDCDIADIQTAVSRARRGVCPPFFYYAGMPDDKNHPMYEYFDERGIPVYEPPFEENEHNVEPTYKAQLKRNYRGTDVDRYLDGKRVALFKQEVIPNMRWGMHVEGRHESVDSRAATLTERLCTYDPYRKLLLGIDFNVAPMCMSAWQIKEWDFGQHTDDKRLKPVLCQVDEYELWNATTPTMMEDFLADYRDHPGGGMIVGDATGNRRDTRSPSETDWTIIKRKLAALDSFGVVPGLVKKRKSGGSGKKGKGGGRRGSGEIVYSNPNRRETINLLNNFMIDSDGDPRILFLRESDLSSGGAAGSVGNAEYDMTSKVDDSNDRSDDRSLPRTHFFDGVRYIVYFVNGRLIHPDPDEVGSRMGGAEVEEKNTFSGKQESKAGHLRAYLQNIGSNVWGN